jgi:phage terminase large subunit-like protein
VDLDVVRWAESRLGFYVDRTWTGDGWALGWRPICLAAYHADILRHVLTPGADGRLPYDVVAWCEPAKSGKSAICGLVAQYVALHGEQNSAVVMASNKESQAMSIMYASFAASVAANPALHLEPGRTETRLDNGNVVRAIPSNSAGEAGARFSLALFDELWAYVHTDALRLWTEFKSDPTRRYCLKLATGYAGYLGEGDLWLDVLNTGIAGRPVLEHITNGNEPACWANGRHFTFWSHEVRQPWQTPDWVESQRAALRPAEFARMIECVFSEGEGDFIDAATWAACVDPAHTPLLPTKERQVFIGLDLALSPGGDDCAAVAVYPDGERVKVAFHELWKGKERRQALKLSESVKPWVLRVAELYDLAGVWFDPWQSQHLADELRAEGVPCHEVRQTHASRGPHDTLLHELATGKRLVLYDHPDLTGAARFANAKELGDGRLFITKSKGRGKIDLLIALSNCARPALEGAYTWLIY